MSSNIERQVMASVGVIYTARQLFSRTAFKLYVCVASLWGMGQLVWVSKVFENLSHVGFNGFMNFVFSAVLNTDTLVQLVLAIFAIALFSLAFEFFRPLSSGQRLFA